jgi:hypothetical protein
LPLSSVVVATFIGTFYYRTHVRKTTNTDKVTKGFVLTTKSVHKVLENFSVRPLYRNPIKRCMTLGVYTVHDSEGGFGILPILAESAQGRRLWM